MMEKKKLLMEFGLRALMEQLPPNVEMGEPLYHYPKGVIDTGKMGQKVFFHPDTIPVMDPDTGIESTKEIVRPFPVPQVRDDYADPTALEKLHPHIKMNEQDLDFPDPAPKRNPSFVRADQQLSPIKARTKQEFFAKQGYLGFGNMAKKLEKPSLPPRNYPKLSYNVRGGVSQDSAPGVDQNLNYRGMGFSTKRAR